MKRFFLSLMLLSMTGFSAILNVQAQTAAPSIKSHPRWHTEFKEMPPVSGTLTMTGSATEQNGVTAWYVFGGRPQGGQLQKVISCQLSVNGITTSLEETKDHRGFLQRMPLRRGGSSFTAVLSITAAPFSAQLKYGDPAPGENLPLPAAPEELAEGTKPTQDLDFTSPAFQLFMKSYGKWFDQRYNKQVKDEVFKYFPLKGFTQTPQGTWAEAEDRDLEEMAAAQRWVQTHLVYDASPAGTGKASELISRTSTHCVGSCVLIGAILRSRGVATTQYAGFHARQLTDTGAHAFMGAYSRNAHQWVPFDGTCYPQRQSETDAMPFGKYGGDMVLTQVGLDLVIPLDRGPAHSDNFHGPYIDVYGSQFPQFGISWQARPASLASLH